MSIEWAFSNKLIRDRFYYWNMVESSIQAQLIALAQMQKQTSATGGRGRGAARGGAA
jgi:hypothetical protein